jgi:hypothetical protein
MVRHRELRILQYNVQKSRDIALASLFQGPRIQEYDVLAIQEPWRNPFIATSYNHLRAHFQLTYLDDAATRVCLYINKRIDLGTWSVSFITKDIIALAITNPTLHNRLHVINVYNEVVTDTFYDLRETISKLDSNDELLVLGDFNLHHPLWSTTHRSTNDGILAAQPLLPIIEDFHLQLLTVPGTSTHRWKSGEPTIDLSFASEDITSRVIHCKVETSLDYNSDHLPIAVAIDWNWQLALPSRKRLCAKTNLSSLRQTVGDRLSRVPNSTELKDKENTDEYVRSIVNALNAGIDASTL